VVTVVDRRRVLTNGYVDNDSLSVVSSSRRDRVPPPRTEMEKFN